jgi:hypothetical protein
VSLALLTCGGCATPAEPPAATAPTDAAPSTAGTPGSSPGVTPGPTPNRVAVPGSIDATGAGDASSALIEFVDSVPDGSTVVFEADGIYRMDRGLRISNRRNLVFEGNGATLVANGTSACGRDCSLFYTYESTGVVIRGFSLVGNSPTPGGFDDAWQHAAAITIVGGGDTEITDVTISGVGGDGLTLSGLAPDWPTGIWFHDSRVVSAGRMGVAVVAGRDVTVERVAFDTVAYGVFDIEPNDGRQGAHDIVFRDNTAGTWTNEQGFFFAANGAQGSAVRGVTVADNVIAGRPLTTSVIVARRQDITFTRNRSDVPAAGPVLRFAHVDGLAITANVQRLTSGALARITDCTAVTSE